MLTLESIALMMWGTAWPGLQPLTASFGEGTQLARFLCSASFSFESAYLSLIYPLGSLLIFKPGGRVTHPIGRLTSNSYCRCECFDAEHNLNRKPAYEE